MADKLIWKIKKVGFKRGGTPRIEMVTYPRSGACLSIKINADKFHVSASGVDLTPTEWVDVVLKVAAAGAEVAGEMIARGGQGAQVAECPKSE